MKNKMKEQKGITLIVLIVTIIVILILVAVTINIIMRRSNSTPVESSNLTDLEKYLFGSKGEGRNLLDIIEEDAENYGITFVQNPEDNTSKIHNNIKFAYYGDNKTEFYIRYGRDVYKFKWDYDDNGTKLDESDDQYLTIPGTLELADKQPENNEGKYVTYQGTTWIVLSDDSDKSNEIELISANSLGNLTLGSTEENSSFANARTSYNNVIETIVNECKTQTGISSNIRSVGGPAVDLKTMNDTIVFSKLTTFTPKKNVTFEDYEGSTNGLKEGDTNYKEDYEQMKKVGILASDNSTDYWLASRYIDERESFIYFEIRYTGADGGLYDCYLCIEYSEGRDRMFR